MGILGKRFVYTGIYLIGVVSERGIPSERARVAALALIRTSAINQPPLENSTFCGVTLNPVVEWRPETDRAGNAK